MAHEFSTIEQTMALAIQHHAAGRLADAEALYRQALSVNPNHAEALGRLGQLAQQVGRDDIAYDLTSRSMAFRPTVSAADCFSTAFLAANILRFPEAIQWCDRAIQLKPQWPDPHVAKAISLLTLGQWTAGWREFAWRWGAATWDTELKVFAQPRWAGEDLKGRTLLVWVEQGLGDMIQLARYFPILASRGAKIIVGCQPPIRSLMATIQGVSAAASTVEETPPFDMHAPVFDVAILLNVTPDNIPSAPYIAAKPELAEAWRRRVAAAGKKLNIGLVWAGSPKHTSDAYRSVRLCDLAGLWQARPDAAFFSLQKGAAAEQTLSVPAEMRLIDWTNELNDFNDTAALVANLDLVISVDTAPAHLAGAMGKPVWTLVAYRPDWRWLLGRDDTAWYPSMRLFRQSAAKDWNSVIARVASELRRFDVPGSSFDVRRWIIERG